ncbi:hypothetical protein F5Y05DRAFT_395150 [Hypoxylon sp. FL0543]|nr:hypothetical protein F5Y05DRAFT_395150 [Hypoxylon sp. FL0543]
MAPPEIPGYYYDAQKRRFFKVEHSQTAPSNAAWSSDKVKKRKLEDEAAAAQLRRASLNRNRIARSRVLNVPLMGGFLAREYGQHIHDLRDIRPASFAHGIVGRGQRNLHDWPEPVNLKHVLVASKIPGEPFCKAYFSAESSKIFSVPIPRDSTGAVDHRLLRETSCATPLGCLCPRWEESVRQVTDIKYSAKANLMLVASEDPDTIGYPLHTFTPKRFRHNEHSALYRLKQSYKDETNRKYTSNTICVAPPASNKICLVGTNLGVAQFDEDCQMRLYTSSNQRGKLLIPDSFRDVFSIDFHADNPNVMFFGGRPGKVFTGDVREEARKWDVVALNNSITHIKSVSQNQVLVAGLRNTLSVFDLRYCDLAKVRDKKDPKTERKAIPVVTMPAYKNAARFDVGLDYDPQSGVVAAAHDDGRIALYSVRSGKRLPSRDVDKVHSIIGPIHSLQFETLDGDKTPSLFVGDENNINVYSFGVDDPDEEA